MYNNPYINNLSLNERIDNEIERLKQMKTQVQQPVQPITQNFQLAPSTGIKYASTLDDVKKEMVYIDTPFFSKDFSVMWLKTAKGEIKPYELTEMITKDEKDIRIEYLQAQIEELKGMIKNESKTIIDEPIAESNKNDEPSNVSKSTKLHKK